MKQASLCPHIVLKPVRRDACRQLPRYHFGACSALLVQGHDVIVMEQVRKPFIPTWGDMGSKDSSALEP